MINGDAGWTGNYTVGGVQSTGDGWDMTHKGIKIMDPGEGAVTGVLVFNCTVENWRGEEIWDGGDSTGTVDIIQDTLISSDADAVSVSANLTVAYCTIGGTTAGDDVYQGVEDFACVTGEQTTVENCTIMDSSSASSVHGNGISLLGVPGTTGTVENSTIENTAPRDTLFRSRLERAGDGQHLFQQQQRDDRLGPGTLSAVPDGLRQYHDLRQQLQQLRCCFPEPVHQYIGFGDSPISC